MEPNIKENNSGARLGLNSISSLLNETLAFYQEHFVTLSEIVLLPALLLLLGYGLHYLGFPFSLLGGLAFIAGAIMMILSSIAIIFSIHNNTSVDASYRT